MENLTINLLLLLACIALAVPHVLALLNFRRRLAVKRRALISLLADSSILDRYTGQFPSRKGLSDAESIARDYFSTYYSRLEYLSALALNFFTGGLALLFITARIGFALPALNPRVVDFVQRAAWGNAVLWSLVGSYLWNCYELIRRTTNFDLTPDAFTRMWLKLWIAAAVASILSAGITAGLQPTVGFAIGLISIPVLFEIISDRASKVLNIKSTEGDQSTPIKLLQGASPSVIDTLNNFDIESTVQLAYCDPMNLMMSTNLPWVVIIDMIDQALLFNYIGADLTKIRGGGYRGAIEVATIGAHLNGTPEQRMVGLRSLSDFAALLGWNESKAMDLVQTLYADGQANLIWDLFGGNFSTRDAARVPDSETVKMVITAEINGAANESAAGSNRSLQKIVAQNQESEISSAREQIAVTVPATPPGLVGEPQQK